MTTTQREGWLTRSRAWRAPAIILALGILAACGGAGSSDSSSGTTPPPPPPPPSPGAPTVSLSASPTTVSSGGSTTLTWSSSNATGCSASGVWSGSKTTSGSQTISSLTTTSTYTLTCTGSGGSTSQSVTVSVGSSSGPAMSLVANPTTVAVNGFSTLTWSSSSATGCSASGAWSGAKGTSGSEQVGPISAASTYTLTCTGASGNASRSVTITVPPPIGSALTTLSVQDRSGAAGSAIPVSFGQVFGVGHVPNGAFLTARTAGTTAESIPLQVDVKARHADGSVRHAVLSTRLPSLAASATKSIELLSTMTPPPAGSDVALADLATTFDAVVTLNVGGTAYTASARQLLQAGPVKQWLSGPLVSEWSVAGPVTTAAGAPHAHLTARFNVRAYAGMDSVRVDVTIENTKSFATGPRNYTYNATVSVAGRGTVLTQNNIPHYRQGRWRRVFWWGLEPNLHVAHSGAYLQATGAVPNFDRTLVIAGSTLDELLSNWNSSPRQLMGNGLIYTSMPDTGARADIGPLPRWDALYILTSDYRAKTASLGVGEQAGSWPIHYRDETTDLPVSIESFPDLWRDAFPACAGTCGNSWQFDSSHQPSLAYLPYLVTGDEFYLEEVQFWTNYNWLQIEPFNRGRASGYVSWDQIRGQAWQLRALGHAAYITPDAHPLKNYFVTRVGNNLRRYDQLFTNNPNTNRLGLNDTTQVWDIPLGLQYNNFLDDFFTWAVGSLVDMGFSDAIGLRAWKSKFPVLRMTDSTYCWLMAAPYESMIGPVGGPIAATIGQTYDLTLQLNGLQSVRGMACNSPQMVAELRRLRPDVYGGQVGEMIGSAWNPEGYPSNMQPALAVARDSGIANADLAWSRFMSRSVKPTGSPPYSYDYTPQYAVVPRTQ